MASDPRLARNRCEWCGAEAAADAIRCEGCGGPVRLLEPWIVECGWCGSSNRRDQTGTCASCGGPLPSIPGGRPGPRPPDPDRTLPRGYKLRALVTRNVLALVGIIFTVVFFWTLLFPLIGIPMWVVGWRRARRQLHALEHGIPTRGRLTAVELDRTQHINGVNPYRVAYAYDTPDGTLPGSSEGWDRAHGRRPRGEHVWVVHDLTDPTIHALWPPIR